MLPPQDSTSLHGGHLAEGRSFLVSNYLQGVLGNWYTAMLEGYNFTPPHSFLMDFST